LDDVAFEILGVTENERNDFCCAVCDLVKNRIRIDIDKIDSFRYLIYNIYKIYV
jgi:hypothetical protein